MNGYSRLSLILLATAGALAIASCTAMSDSSDPDVSRSLTEGPADQGQPLPQELGVATAGRDVFRFETFGNEGFWTDAVRLPAGIAAARVTPMQALELGLQVDADAVDAATKAQLAAELRADPSGRSQSC